MSYGSFQPTPSARLHQDVRPQMHRSDSTPTVGDVVEFVREFAGLKTSDALTPATKLDADLGITGDDGSALLAQAAEVFGTQLEGPDGYVTTFGLRPNEFLFHSEGLGPIWPLPAHTVRDLTIGELHEAICRSRPSAAQFRR